MFFLYFLPGPRAFFTGIKEVRLRHISKKFKYLYCYAELSEETEEICDAKLMDDNGNVIMYLQGFKVGK